MISSTSITNTCGNKFLSVYFCLSKRFVEYWKMVSLPVVLLIFITSNSPQGKLDQGILDLSQGQPEKGFADSGKSPKISQVNDLTTVDFKFPDDHARGKIISDRKIIREKLVPEKINEKNEKSKSPVPLYSLVKNDCGEGYALDENGMCQKTITARSEKQFEDRRRKRSIWDYEWITSEKKEKNLRNVEAECSKLYPGMIPDGNGGCKKSTEFLEQPLDKTLPP